MTSLDSGVIVYQYEGLDSFENLMFNSNRDLIRVHMTQADLNAMTEDIQNNIPSFKYFSVMSVTDYFEHEKGVETYGNSVVRNEAKFIFLDKTLEVEVYDINGQDS